MKRIVILVSGRGSNMLAVIRACAAQRWPAQVVAVISNRPGAEALVAARAAGVPTVALDHQAYASRDAFDQALAEAVDGHQPDLVVLAGFMRVLGGAFVQRYQGRMLNIHPSLLPAFTGLHTHRRALATGCKAAGATVHFVSTELDHGPIVMQAVAPVMPDDDEHSLAARVLALEHVILVQAVRWFVHDELQLGDDGRVQQRQGASQLLI